MMYWLAVVRKHESRIGPVQKSRQERGNRWSAPPGTLDDFVAFAAGTFAANVTPDELIKKEEANALEADQSPQ